MPNFDNPTLQFPGQELFAQLGWNLHTTPDTATCHAAMPALAGRGSGGDGSHRRRWPGARKRR